MKHKTRKKLKSLKKSKKVARRRKRAPAAFNREIQELIDKSVHGGAKISIVDEPAPVRTKRATPTTVLRYVEPGDYALVKQAALAKGKSINMFIVGASLEAAKKALDLEEPVGAAG